MDSRLIPGFMIGVGLLGAAGMVRTWLKTRARGTAAMAAYFFCFACYGAASMSRSVVAEGVSVVALLISVYYTYRMKRWDNIQANGPGPAPDRRRRPLKYMATLLGTMLASTGAFTLGVGMFFVGRVTLMIVPAAALAGVAFFLGRRLRNNDGLAELLDPGGMEARRIAESKLRNAIASDSQQSETHDPDHSQ